MKNRLLLSKTSMLLSLVLVLSMLVPVLAYAASKVSLVYDGNTGRLSGTIYSDTSNVSLDVYSSNQTVSVGTYSISTVSGSTYEIKIDAYIQPGLAPDYAAIREGSVSNVVYAAYAEQSAYGFSKDDKPAAPANLRATLGYASDGRVTFRYAWDASTSFDTVSYQVYLNDNYLGETNRLYYYTDFVERNFTHKICVKAVDAGGNVSEESAIDVFVPALLDVQLPAEMMQGAYLKAGDTLFSFKPVLEGSNVLDIEMPWAMDQNNRISTTAIYSKFNPLIDLVITDNAGELVKYKHAVPTRLDSIDNPNSNVYSLRIWIDGAFGAGKTYTVKMSSRATGDELRTPDIRTASGHMYIALLNNPVLDSGGVQKESRFFGTLHFGDWSAPAVPSGLAASAGDGQVVLSWTAVQASDMAGYKLYQNGNLLTTVTGTTYTITGLTNNTQYGFQVASVDMLGNISAKSETVNATPSVFVVSGPVYFPPVGPGDDTVVVNTESLKNGKDGKVAIEIADGKKQVLLPAHAADIVKENVIEVKAKDVTIRLPKEVLQQFQALVPVEQLKDAQIKLAYEKVSNDDAAALLSQSQKAAHAMLTAAGDVFEFTLAVVAKDGQATKLTQFKKPVTLQLKVNADANKDLAGVYYIGDSGELEYVGGTLEDGVMKAEVYHFSKYAVLEFNKTYSDVPAAHWAADVIQKLSAKHVLNGVSDTAFDPNGNVTRAEFAKMLVQAFGLKSVTGAVYYQDVPSDAWYAGAVAAASEAGIIKGRDAGVFAPDAAITREEMATMIIRTYHAVLGQKTTTEKAAPFADAAAVSDWAAGDVAAAAELKLMNGRENNVFAPNDTASRAESAKVIANMLALLEAK